jgi:hypothetical protein
VSGQVKVHPTLTPEYWESLARSERSFAKHKRRSRFGTVESIRVHERDAEQYQREADRLRGEAK